jgi:Rps23 Pro-64 3,4-dihydroxylase Tpa1-like proline 4-hydroxylase
METLLNRIPDRESFTNKEVLVKNLSFGVNLYSGSFKKEECVSIIERLNRELDGSASYSWTSDINEEDIERGVDSRKALDFKVSYENLGPRGGDNIELYKISDLVFSKIKECIRDYESVWEIGITRYEPLNFIKYEGSNTYFDVHIDHGPGYPRTVSAVVYLNDDYEGGELRFPRLDNLEIKPAAGDIVLFPSNYLYSHASKNIISGTKYSVASMTDYTIGDPNG